MLSAFQFLMVQLKVPELRYQTRQIEFQFLMVQLKDEIVGAKLLFVEFQFLMVQLKDGVSGCVLQFSGLFQFLMVQLKVTNCVICSTISIISIPYGSIKRDTEKSFYYSEEPFQFLMVQLKEPSAPTYKTDLTNFNS